MQEYHIDDHNSVTVTTICVFQRLLNTKDGILT